MLSNSSNHCNSPPDPIQGALRRQGRVVAKILGVSLNDVVRIDDDGDPDFEDLPDYEFEAWIGAKAHKLLLRQDDRENHLYTIYPKNRPKILAKGTPHNLHSSP